MGYELDAILAKHTCISRWHLKSPLVYRLTAELGLIPMTSCLFDQIKPLEEWAKGASRETLVAHITASYFGGTGDQDCTLWRDGKSKSGMKINEVLLKFGVKPKDSLDAFDTVGLGRFRSNANWAAHAVVDAMKDSIDDLIGALKYSSGDKEVEHKVRGVAASRLGELKAVKSLDALKQMLHDSDYGTRLNASSALESIGAPALPILIEALSSQNDPWGVLFALGKIGPEAKSAAPHVVALLHHADWRIRLECIRALELMGCVGKEVETLLKDEDKLVRDAAGKALNQSS